MMFRRTRLTARRPHQYYDPNARTARRQRLPAQQHLEAVLSV